MAFAIRKRDFRHKISFDFYDLLAFDLFFYGELRKLLWHLP